METILFFAGLIFLIVGAEALVRGASRLASSLGVSPLIVGLTVVAFGTSSPELAVSVKAALGGQASIAVGNVVGSNIFNVLFILGLSALIVPLSVSQQLVRFDVPLMIALSLLVLVLALDSTFSRFEGLLLILGLVLYVWLLVRASRRERGNAKQETSIGSGGGGPSAGSWAINAALVLGGLGLLVLGSQWLVDGAVHFAQRLGVSELVIGLTIVACGTSLPEVVTSLIAAVRGERDIAVGNVVGSNIFNIMGVLGCSSLAAPSGIEVLPGATSFDIPVMIVVAFACLPIFFTGGVISRGEGALFLAYYPAYTVYLVLSASEHDALASYGTVMLYFVIPLTLVTLVVIAVREARRARPRSE